MNQPVTRDRTGEARDVPQREAQLQADARTRTGDPFITSEVLYQLSYVGMAWKASFEYSPGSPESQIARRTMTPWRQLVLVDGRRDAD